MVGDDSILIVLIPGDAVSQFDSIGSLSQPRRCLVSMTDELQLVRGIPGISGAQLTYNQTRS
ncbi:hypothetical protein ATC00_12080 [Sinorhizobium americanum]|nr:hypothetical protein ATC00_12080 [Sinorhizobium americanum]